MIKKWQEQNKYEIIITNTIFEYEQFVTQTILKHDTIKIQNKKE